LWGASYCATYVHYTSIYYKKYIWSAIAIKKLLVAIADHIYIYIYIYFILFVCIGTRGSVVVRYDSIFINDHFKYITSELAKLTKNNIYL
jgi:hypothetical protein